MRTVIKFPRSNTHNIKQRREWLLKSQRKRYPPPRTVKQVSHLPLYWGSESISLMPGGSAPARRKSGGAR